MIDVLRGLLERVKEAEASLTDGDAIGDVLLSYKDDIMELQLRQLFEGKASSGEDLRPYYSEDLMPSGYFRSAESAKRYADWKQTIQYPYKASRNPDAPNLYINGKFHSELEVDLTSEAVEVVASTSYADDIVAKYGRSSFGLTPDNWDIIWRERGAYERLLNEIRQMIYGE